MGSGAGGRSSSWQMGISSAAGSGSSDCFGVVGAGAVRSGRHPRAERRRAGSGSASTLSPFADFQLAGFAARSAIALARFFERARVGSGRARPATRRRVATPGARNGEPGCAVAIVKVETR